MTHKIGPKEQQRIDLRLKRYAERGPAAKASRARPVKPVKFFTIDRETVRAIMDNPSKPISAPVKASALPKETTMKTKSKAKSPTKKRSVSEAAANRRKAMAGGKRRGKSANASTTRAKKADARARKSDAAEANARTAVRPESKLAIVAGLLQRPEGCTGAEILAATGWPTVSVPQQAKAAGLTLSKEKDGKVSRYRGTPVAAPPV